MNVREQNPVALVTGGSRGIGRAICERLAREGYAVVVNFHSRQDAAEETCEAIRKAGGTAWAHQANILKQDEVREMFSAVEKRHGRLDVLVNNAGRAHEGLFALTPADKFWEIVQANLMGAVLCSQAALRLMLRRRRGVIINITSTAARGPVGLSAYGAAKAAVNSLTGSLAREVAGKGIRVNAVAPSWTQTAMLANSNQEVLEEAARRIPVGRFAKVEEVAAAVSALVHEDMSYVVGQVLQLDGGGVR